QQPTIRRGGHRRDGYRQRCPRQAPTRSRGGGKRLQKYVCAWSLSGALRIASLARSRVRGAKRNAPSNWLVRSASAPRTLRNPLKQRRADADDRRALLDRNFIVAAHAHGELVHQDVASAFGFESLAQLPQRYEIATCAVGATFERSHR